MEYQLEGTSVRQIAFAQQVERLESDRALKLTIR
jgi:hypothetical protein